MKSRHEKSLFAAIFIIFAIISYASAGEVTTVSSAIPLSELMTAVDVKEGEFVGSPEYFKAKLSSGQTYIDLGEDLFIKQEIINGEKKEGTTEREKISWDFKDYEIQQALYNNLIKEDIIVKNQKGLDAVLDIKWKLSWPDSVSVHLQDNSILFTIKEANEKGEETTREVAHLLPPTAVDSAGKSFDFSWQLEGNILSLKGKGLSDITFPLYIDPSYTVQTTTLTTATAYANGRKLARTSNGDLHCVYYRSDGTYNQIYYAKSTDGGQTWAETEIVNEDYGQTAPSIAVDSNDYIHIVWWGKHSGSTAYNQVRYIKYTGSWSSIENLTNENYDQDRAAIAVDSKDYIHIAWYGKHSGSTAYNQVRYIKYTGSWSSIENLTNENYDQERPAMAIDSNDYIHIVWWGKHSGSTSYTQIRYIKYTTSWSSIENLTNENYNQGRLAIAIDSNDYIHIAWSGTYSGSPTLSMRYMKYTTNWSNIENLTKADYSQYCNAMAIDSNDYIHILWNSRHSGSTTDYEIGHIQYTTSWGSVEYLTSGSSHQQYSSLIWALHPTVKGAKTNRPKHGYAFVWMDGTTVKIYKSSDLEWDPPLDSSSTLVSKDANKKEVVVGDIVTYTVTIKNETASDIRSVYLEDKIPAGFKYISGKAILDNVPIADPTGNRPLTFNIGTVQAGQTRTLKYQLVVGSGVTFGNYENAAFAKLSDVTISNTAQETVRVVPDPMFDLGTVIGKVFWDRNENGIQDSQQKIESGIANVQIATEDGTLITTDKDGKYHLQSIIPGRHLFRLDERSLPPGAYLTTDKVVIVDITPGILAKVNFGVNSKDREQITEDREQKLPVKITQEREKPEPRLNVACYVLDGKYEFRLFTNYSLFIDKWKLEILDKDTKALIKRFEGSALTINEPIYWDGYSENTRLTDGQGKQITEDPEGQAYGAGRSYVYVLSVTGKDGKDDVTKERELVVRGQRTENRGQRTEEEIEKQKQEWIEQESKINNLDSQNIRIEGETIQVTGYKSQVSSIKILKSGKLEGEIPIVQPQGITASELLESPQDLEKPAGELTTEIILPNGEYDIEGEHLKVGEDYLFFVGMGDAKMGYTFKRGDIEPVQQDDKFKEGFWSEGKLAYYLKGKLKGKYLITSSLDTERDKKELFRNLDPDRYYPIYGDTSSINYDATNTQGLLYLLVEWDKSSAIWGNYNTAFTDTEFAAFNRTLYGGKLYLESVSTTKFGEPHTKLIVFRARAQQRAAHNEFVGTGGSLYYLKNKDVIEGSEKLKIEVRDKITGLVLATKQMQGGFDYEIDYANGRLTFWQPISYIVESDSIISSSLLDGNSVYVVVDYEYETKDKYDEGIIGARAQQSLSDYLRVGTTYVKEAQLDKNYELKGTDVTLHLGKDIKLTGEYAQSESEEVGSFISTDGGLSFTELATGDLDKGKAYGLKGEAHLFERLGLSTYYKQIEKGFSSTATTSQQGKKLMGVGATFDLTSKTRLKLSHDIQKLINDGNLQAQLQVGAKETETTTAQITHEATEKLKLTGEYRHQKVTEKLEQFESQDNKEEDTAAIKADYKLTEKIDVSVEQQATLKGSPNHQTTAGIQAKVNEKVSLRAKETIGTQGTATSLGATANLKDKLQVSSDYTRSNYKTGQISDTVSLSGKAKVDEKTDVHTTIAVTDSSEGGQTQSLVFGSERKVNEELKLASNKTYAKSRDNLTQANTYGLTKEKDGKKLEGTFTEQRSQSDTEASNTNIFALSGDINDKWAAQGSFERGTVQNHDGTQYKRNAGSVGLGFMDKDSGTGEVKLKASSKLELRLDEGQEDKRQFLIYNALEGKINPNTTLFAKANLSQTKNTTLDSTEVQYKEFVTGLAYRPVNFDRLNLLGKYTYLEDDSPSGQSDISSIEKEKSHTLAGEAVYDLTDKWQLVEKLAYKMAEERVSGFDFTETQTWLEITRFNYNIDKDWQVGAEYRRLTQKQAKDYKQGALVEITRKIGEFIQAGAGYNLTDFNDDLTHLDYTSQGPFIRFTVKFYDRTPEEIERAREKWLEEKIKQWAWELVNDELAQPDSPIMQELYDYYYLAKKFEDEGKLNQAKECYERTLKIGRMMYAEAEEYIRSRVGLEKELKEYNTLALAYYKEGKLQEAKKLWEKILKETEPKPISLEIVR